jgi:hypothetical protein
VRGACSARIVEAGGGQGYGDDGQASPYHTVFGLVPLSTMQRADCLLGQQRARIHIGTR